MTIQSGTRLGPYEVVGPIGAGGMGEVYRAKDTRLERSVAIKILPAEFAANTQLRLRFEREAKTISQLNHPHICTLFDVGHDQDIHYLVMEYVEGESLADRVVKGPLPIEQVLRYGIEIADALDKAHRQGIVHRDLKPGNVMLTKSGAKLLDFGLAKLTLAESGGILGLTAMPTEQKPLTQEGTILGTFQYMAPEQLEGREADARTDLFAFGAVLYEMATGKHAFEGKSKASLIAAIVSGQPQSVSQLQPLTPPALEHVMKKCLEKDPEDRWQSAHDVAEELRWVSAAGSQAGLATPVLARRKTRERLTWSAALIATAIIALLGGWLIPRRVQMPSYSFTIPSSGGDYRNAWGGWVSPDGTKVVFRAQNADRKVQLWTRSLDGLDVKPIPGTEWPVFFLAWSPDSKYFAVHKERKVMKIPAAGGPAEPIAEVPTAWYGDWNRDGDILLATGEAPLGRIAPGSRTVEPITTLDKSKHEIGHVNPEFLPDGRRFLFTAITRDPKRADHSHRLYAGSLDSKETRFLGEISSVVRYVEPGLLLAVRDGTLLAYPFDVKKLKITGDPFTVADDVFYFKPTGVALFSVSSDGVLVTQGVGAGQRLYWLTAEGKPSSPIGPAASYEDMRISPDGKSLAVGIADAKVGTADIWIQGLDRETTRRLTFEASWEGTPVWSPDGARLYYAADRTGWPDIYTRVIDSGEEELLLARHDLQFPLDVSPDGKFLLYQTFEEPGSSGDLFVMPLEGERKPRPFVKTPFAEGAEARFSPNGRWIAYVSSESGRPQVYVKPFPGPGRSRQISIDRGGGPRWSANGRRLFFLNQRQVMVVDFSPASGTAVGEPRLLFETASEIGTWEVAADGRFLAAVETQEGTAPLRVVVNWPRLLK